MAVAIYRTYLDEHSFSIEIFVQTPSKLTIKTQTWLAGRLTLILSTSNSDFDIEE